MGTPPRSATATALGTALAVGLLAGLALVTDQPFVFPSLGPTAFLLVATPTEPAASPRNTVLGHAIGVGAGYLALVAFGLVDAPADLAAVDGARVGATALAIGLTSGGMLLARVPHPPAGATTLLVALGLLSEPGELAVLLGAVVLLVALTGGANRLAGVPYPAWRPSR